MNSVTEWIKVSFNPYLNYLLEAKVNSFWRKITSYTASNYQNAKSNIQWKKKRAKR